MIVPKIASETKLIPGTSNPKSSDIGDSDGQVPQHERAGDCEKEPEDDTRVEGLDCRLDRDQYPKPNQYAKDGF